MHTGLGTRWEPGLTWSRKKISNKFERWNTDSYGDLPFLILDLGNAWKGSAWIFIFNQNQTKNAIKIQAGPEKWKMHRFLLVISFKLNLIIMCCLIGKQNRGALSLWSGVASSTKILTPFPSRPSQSITWSVSLKQQPGSELNAKFSTTF